ncbi:GILT-like protein 1 [Homalodisca vitripennis]|uniref:GILT-like protein 1 n=1 Tax=Homalodisca vitripennis TaxID=197043 RepID=UPI001EEA99FD|nr:GILT-like protein 1 [Homalodisca vitripennis]
MAVPILLSSLALLALSATAFAAAPMTQEKIPVTVYFESYCPDSVKFLTKQLYPTFLTPLGQYMTVSLIPYGKAKTQRAESGDVTFSCHHGEKECRGNKAIACTLKSPSSTFEDQFKFINCTSSIIAANINMEQYPINDCAAGSIFKANDIQMCMEGA